jgi:hypothetical protein
MINFSIVRKWYSMCVCVCVCVGFVCFGTFEKGGKTWAGLCCGMCIMSLYRLCKRHQNMFSCTNFVILRIRHSLLRGGGNGRISVYIWVRKKFFDSIREAYEDKAMIGCSSNCKVFIHQILKITKFTTSGPGAFHALHTQEQASAQALPKYMSIFRD